MTLASLKIQAEQLDADDALRTFRDEFHLPRDRNGQPLIYFCGHSLGLQPISARALVEQELEDWQRLGVEGHFAGTRPWLSYHEQLAPGLASLAGAHGDEVVAMNSLSVNLHLLLISFYRPTTARFKILIEQAAFPSDRYAIESQLRLHGFDPSRALVEVAPRAGESLVRMEDIEDILAKEGQSIATVLLPGVQYLTGQLFDIAAITSLAHKRGCLVGFDLAHAIGNVPLALHDANVDFAVWCSYKYLNGGPGAIGGAFVHQRHASSFELPRLAGWWGHDKQSRFAMPSTFTPLIGAEGWQLSNPPILAMSPLLASLAIFQRAGLQRLHNKSRQLSEFLAQGITGLSSCVRVLAPTPDIRGAQLSLVIHATAQELQSIRQRLTAAGVVFDWREPNVLRVAPTPLYNTYKEAWTLINIFREIFA
jgi:kynureninase